MQDERIPQAPQVDEPAEPLAHPLPLDQDQDLQDSWEYHRNCLLAVVYPDKNRASKVLKTLKKLESPKLIDLEDAVYVTRDKKGGTQLREPGFFRKKNTIGDSIVGMVAGSILLTPIDGATLAVATSTVRYKVSNIHIEDRFILDVRAGMQPNSSTIFLLVGRASPAEVIPRITPYGGTILQTYLTQDEKTRLEAALKASRVH
ncbi:MAG: DUF1269 domain-containing protein [Ktedonobacterales bacterium]